MDLRWIDDRRGRGIAGAEELLPQIDRLRSVMNNATWVAEEPEVHLLPHIRRAVESEASRWSLLGVLVEDAVLVVTLETQVRLGPAEVRADALTIIGSFVEANTFIREDRAGDATTFEVVTGMLDDDGQFAGHGHVVRLVMRA